MAVEDWEDELCNKTLKKYLSKNKTGKIVNQELQGILHTVFMQGYILGCSQNHSYGKVEK